MSSLVLLRILFVALIAIIPAHFLSVRLPVGSSHFRSVWKIFKHFLLRRSFNQKSSIMCLLTKTEFSYKRDCFGTLS